MSERLTVAAVDRDLQEVKTRVSKLEQIQTDMKLEMVKELTKISERQSNTYNAVEKQTSTLERLDIRISEIDRKEDKSKAKWYDEVVKYIVLALLAYIAVNLGIK